MRIIQAEATDIPAILSLQKLAYQTEAELYHDYAIPPLLQDEASILKDLQTGLILKTVTNHEIIGSVRATLNGSTCYIGRLIVAPEWQNQGIGKQLMRTIEEAHPDAERYELFTGNKSIKNLALYQQLGYKVFASKFIHQHLTLIFLQKENNSFHLNKF